MTSKDPSINTFDVVVVVVGILGIVALIAAAIGATGFADSTEEFDKDGCVVRIFHDRSWWETTDITITKFCKENSK